MAVRLPLAKGMLVAKSLRPAAEVFLNIPYDSKFEKLFLAYIAGITSFGMVPRATLEIATSSRRLDRILELIRSCRYSIHDLSRVELDRSAPRTPRFNMPFELGLTVASQRLSRKTQHEWFVCEAKAYRVTKSLSDLNGTDAFVHNGKVGGLFREICAMFRRPGLQPTVQQMWTIYRKLRRNLPTVLRNAGSASMFNARVFRDLCVIAIASADEIVS
jgi:hypothetical protein